MKNLAMKTLTTLAASLCMLPQANASGFIVVDPIAGVPTAAIGVIAPPSAGLPTARIPTMRIPTPRIPSILRPPGRPPGRPPVITPTPPAHPVLKGSVSVGLHLQAESVRVDINDQVAKTYITQTFANNTDRNLAGTYLFPLPDDTTFSSFSLHIDGKPVEGKILEATEARQQYEDIVRRMVDPGLLEYADYKTVRARIFPIPAHGTKKVELEYTQILRAENGMLKYRFPLKSEGQSSAADEIKVDVKLASSQGLRTIWSPSHTIGSTKADDHHARVSLSEHNTVPDKDFLLYYSVSDKELSANLLTHKDEGEYGYFLMTLTPPLQTKQVVGKDIVLVADTSGSMSGEKMEQNQKALKYVVNALNAADRFNVVQFNTDVEKFRSQLILATPENKKAAIQYIEEMEARGGTNIGDALKTGRNLLAAESERPAYLVFMTDGEPTVGETDVAKLIKAADGKRDVRVFDFGIGYDVNTRLLNKLADNNHGTSQYVEPDENIETALAGFYQKIKSPVLSDVSISYDGIQVKDVYPRAVKDIFAGSQVLLMGKYKGSGKAVVKLTGKVNGVARAYSFPLSFAAEETGHTYLPRLWAMRRIGHLTEVAQDNGNNREIVDEIVALSKKHGIITAYTSFLATDPSEGQRLANGGPMPRPVPPSAAAPMPMTRGAHAVPVVRGGGFAQSMAEEKRNARVAFETGRYREDSPRRQGADDGNRSLFDARDFAGAPQLAGAIAKAKNEVSGKEAVARSKKLDQLRTASVSRDEDKEAGVKTLADKTFYLRGGFWTDSAFEADRSARPETITFGSQAYFDLVRKLPGLSKYLAVGNQAIVCFKGHTYKIVAAASG